MAFACGHLFLALFGWPWYCLEGLWQSLSPEIDFDAACFLFLQQVLCEARAHFAAVTLAKDVEGLVMGVMLVHVLPAFETLGQLTDTLMLSGHDALSTVGIPASLAHRTSGSW